MNGQFSASRYFDQDTQRSRWAVMAYPSNVWYFPTRYGFAAAQALANKLNRVK